MLKRVSRLFLYYPAPVIFSGYYFLFPLWRLWHVRLARSPSLLETLNNAACRLQNASVIYASLIFQLVCFGRVLCVFSVEIITAAHSPETGKTRPYTCGPFLLRHSHSDSIQRAINQQPSTQPYPDKLQSHHLKLPHSNGANIVFSYLPQSYNVWCINVLFC